MRRGKYWYEQKEFWHAGKPFLFSTDQWARAPAEVENVINLLNMKKGASVLDLCCGVGRHSIELARHGFHVTGVDKTLDYLKEARRRAKKEGLKIQFIKDDMRRFRRKTFFDVVLNLFTSFGYFEHQEDDRRVVRNVYASLKKNGTFLVEVMGKEVLARIFQKRDWFERNGCIILEDREPVENWTYIKSRWIVLRGTTKKEFMIKIRLYSAVELIALLKNVGFKTFEAYGSLAGTPYDHTAKRLVVVARKG